MKFKEIELAGFKSFADRLQIKFDEGITAIVGPNGCGKSNVADAIRWVLGEQSSKQLRGTTMQDVIFSGTKKRNGLSYCEASLTFNNQDRFFDLDYDEIEVTRKLYRSGESEYLINKQPTRLKDIINLFYDSGIGRDGYSIIGQGKVEEIITSKPETRRLIFEEAAGIAKFKSRKVEAERKLDKANDNLSRLRDILFELERQLEPLKKQAEVAKKYLLLKENLKDLEINSYVYQYENATQTKLKINEKLLGIKQELQIRENEFNELGNEYEKNSNLIDKIDDEIVKVNQKILSVTVENEKQTGEVNLINERITHISEQNKRIENDIKNAKTFIENAKIHAFEKKERQEKLKKEIKNENQEIIKSNEQLKEVIVSLEIIETQLAKDTKDILLNVEKITDIKSMVSKLTTEKDILLISQKELKDKQSNYVERLEKIKKFKQEVETKSEEKEQELQQIIKQRNDNILKTQFESEQKQKNENIRTNMFAKLQVYENRRRLLTEMQAEFEGYSHSVKKLLRESEKNNVIKDKIVGVLANLIKVPVKFETAIEVALGYAVQNIVTYSEQNAKDLISYLKQNEFGRATFLPISTMKSRRLQISGVANEEKGIFGIASDLVIFDEKLRNVIENLLGATIIVDNLDTAIMLAEKTKYAIKIVTQDGDIINPQGSFTGGSRKNDTVNLISRQREIQTLLKEIERLKLELGQVVELIKNHEINVNAFRKELEEIEKSKSLTEIILAKENEKLKALDSDILNVQSEKDENFIKLKNIEEKLNSLFFNLEKLDKIEKGTDNFRPDNFSSNDMKKREEVAQLGQKKDELVGQITQSQVKISAYETELNSIDDELIRVENEILKNENEMYSNEELLSKNLKIHKEANDILNEFLAKKENQKAFLQLENMKKQQEEFAQNKTKKQVENKNLMDLRSKLGEEISSLKEKKYIQEMQTEKVDTDIEIMKERILEEYQLDYESCVPFKREDFEIEKSNIEISKLKKEILKLGYVNVNAIEDSKEVLSRYEMLSSQEKDLLVAQKDLCEIIDELSKEMQMKFKTEFDKINENFKITFKELFGGGSASLQLLDENNILESGVEIIAEPPGKNLKSITLLSGGEKALTAIAILFAILRMRPMPFCLLDEIEAALDEANVDRFAQYLKKFSKTTQFIVITHRKPTMELADSLYGVTMEEEGVSAMVSVKLSDAIKTIDEKEVS